MVNVIGSEALGSRQWKSIFPQAAAPAAPLLAASINSILTPSAENSTCEHSRNCHDIRCALHKIEYALQECDCENIAKFPYFRNDSSSCDIVNSLNINLKITRLYIVVIFSGKVSYNYAFRFLEVSLF